MSSEYIPTIAVVDDHNLVREQTCKMLSLIGFDVIIRATNGKDFLKQLALGTLPDLCLLDINMPEMNGVQTAICLKTIHPQIKILAHTFDSEERSLMLESGADACLIKGGSLAELKTALLALNVLQ